MFHDGITTLGDARARRARRLDVVCPECNRRAGLWLASLIRERGEDCTLAEIFAGLSGDCPARSGDGPSSCCPLRCSLALAPMAGDH